MATFGRGVRLELKRITGLETSGFTTRLSVPSSANYFIFLNKIALDGGVSAQLLRQDLAGSTGSITTSTTALSSERVYVDYLSGVQDATLTNDFESRIIYPNDALQLSGNGVNTYYLIWYTEVYFGGQSNY